jgi:hypothetical protein
MKYNINVIKSVWRRLARGKQNKPLNMRAVCERIEEGDLDAINEVAQSVLDERINLGYMRLLAVICR